MKRFYSSVSLFVLLMFLIGGSYCECKPLPIGDIIYDSLIEIHVIDKNTLELDKVVTDVLKIQSSLLVDPNSETMPGERVENGFILVKMTPQYLKNLIVNSDAMVVGAYSLNKLLGYILLTDPSEFMDLYQNPKRGNFECTSDLSAMESLFRVNGVKYIEQIAVHPMYPRRGVGTKLIDSCKELAPNGLIADVFIEPVINQASLLFFAKKGFANIGILHQAAWNGFFPHQTSVLFWSPMGE